jgi:hypothetical protein
MDARVKPGHDARKRVMTNDAGNGGCLCGAVRFQAEGPPKWVAHCHCRSCRRATGAALATYAGFAREKVTFVKGTPKSHASSPGVMRRFCGACGTPLSYEGQRWPDEIHLFVVTFDDPAGFAPQAHVNTAEQVPWLKIHDELPRYAAFGDSA